MLTKELTQRGHVIRLDPTCKQANALVRAVGCSRFTYNWALAEWDRQYQEGGKPNATALKRQFNDIKHVQFPWILESPRDANSQPFTDLGRAFTNFFASCSGKRKGKKIGYPKPRRKGVNDSFYIANDRFAVRRRGKGKRGIVCLSVIGDVRMQEPLRWRGRILSGRVFRKAGQWYIAINVEVDARVPHVHEHVIVGVDLGLKTAVVPSHGLAIDSPKPLRAALQQLKRANRRLHRRVKGSANRYKARILLARIHQRIANVRKDFWHKVTTRLCRENQVVVVEDLSMEFMLRNRKLARAASDVAPGMFRPMLLYKALVYGSEVVIANRLYPSTQRCSDCTNVKTGKDKMVLGESVYVCGKCGMVKDRDFNSALDLEQYPRLVGNWGCKARTPMDDCTSTRQAGRASAVAEVGTNPCPLVDTI